MYFIKCKMRLQATTENPNQLSGGQRQWFAPISLSLTAHWWVSLSFLLHVTPDLSVIWLSPLIVSLILWILDLFCYCGPHSRGPVLIFLMLWSLCPHCCLSQSLYCPDECADRCNPIPVSSLHTWIITCVERKCRQVNRAVICCLPKVMTCVWLQL